MKTTLAWCLVLACSAGGLLGLGALISSGCYYEVCPECTCEDGGGVDGECAEGPRAVIQGYEPPGNYVTLEPGEQVDLTAAPAAGWTAPAECLPISYHWDLGNGSTAEGASSGPVSYSAAGYYTLQMTASSPRGTPDESPDVLYASLWNGALFQDDFERDAVAHDTSGWSYRVVDSLLDLDRAPDWEIAEFGGGRWLHAAWGAEGDDTYCQPGSQALLSRLEAIDARVSVVQSRATPRPTVPHYSDIILRFNYVEIGQNNPVVRFYRARIQEEDEGAGYCICVDAFKIDGENQVGLGLDGSDVNTCGNRQCEVPAGTSFHVTAEISGTASQATITVEVRMSAGDSLPWHSHTFVDASSPIAEPGRFGISQCWGETYFDDFRFERTD